MSILYWHEAGPRISYGNEMFVVEDLNPENRIGFVMSKEEMRGLAYDILRNLGETPELEAMTKDRDYWYRRYEETVRKLPIRRKADDRMWPNWGDSPNGFDGPGGAE